MIELAEARDLLKRAMETQGRDFVYAISDSDSNFYGCFNVPVHEIPTDVSEAIPRKYFLEDLSQDHPKRRTGCIIGTALTLAGHQDICIREPRSSIHEINDSYHLLVREAEYYWSVAQGAQDQGQSWGEAYDAAEQWLVDAKVDLT